jgi:Tol biopolymer transport system component
VTLLLGCLLAFAACGEGGLKEPAVQSSPASPSQTNPAEAGDSDLSGRLLFSRFDVSSHTFISTHVSRPDGSEETEIALPGPEGGGRWSRAGTHIAVMTMLADNRIGTAIITPDGTVTRVLDIPDDDLNLPCTVWSPDDSRLACEGWDEADPSRSGIYTVRSSDGGDLVRLTKPPSDATDVPGDYSPDGKKVLFKRGAAEADGTLMIVPAAGGKHQAFWHETVEDPGRYSPDGKTVLTSSGGAILLLDNSGHRVGRIADESQYLFGAVWSPDGSHIAFSGATSGPFADIYTSLPDGTDRHRATSTPDNEIVVEWGSE